MACPLSAALGGAEKDRDQDTCRWLARMLARAVLLVAGAAAGNLAASGAGQAQALDKVSFATNWVAEAEHGGFYQALADGTYRRYGLDVTIVPGGPQVNNRLLLAAGRIDFYLSANTVQSLDAVSENIPTLAVAAMFQKDPQALLTHPDRGVTGPSDLKGMTLYVSKEGMATYFLWLKAFYGIGDDRVRPYTSNPQPFLADRNSAMQAYVTSEPFAIERASGMKPAVMLLADYGFDPYSTLIETRRDVVATRPAVVQRFVDASIIGWYNYIYHDNAAANDLIKRQNPEMTDDLLAWSVKQLRNYGIVDSGDAVELGIGAMSEARVRAFYDKMVAAGVVKAGLDWRRSYTLQFVNRKVGTELRPK